MRIHIKDVEPYKSGKRWDIVKDAIDYPVLLNLGLGNGTSFQVMFFRTVLEKIDKHSFKISPRIFIGIEKVGCFLFREGGQNFVFPRYVAEKLNLCMGDANNIADWINAQLNVEAKEFGQYFDELCIDRPANQE